MNVYSGPSFPTPNPSEAVSRAVGKWLLINTPGALTSRHSEVSVDLQRTHHLDGYRESRESFSQCSLCPYSLASTYQAMDENGPQRAMSPDSISSAKLGPH